MADKIFHPDLERCLVKETDREALDLCAFILQGFGWRTQQGGIEQGLAFLCWIYETLPEGTLKACSNGLTVIVDALN